MASKLLIVDDEKAICDLLAASLQDEGYEVQTAQNGNDALKLMSTYRPDVVMLDIWMPGEMDGLEVLRRARPQFPQMQFLIMSGHGTIETAVKATKLGAWDFVEKPLSMDKILILLSNILSYQSERSEKIALLNKLRKNIALVGESDAMKTIKQTVARAASHDEPVWIIGEEGTGKGLVAENIHYLSPRASYPFVEVNCRLLPETLAESELFGFEKGAFGGLDHSSRGKLELAQGGTLFLNGVGSLPQSAIDKLNETIRTKKMKRLGGDKDISINVRIVMSKVDKNSIAIGENSILLAPLRMRSGDVESLTTHFSENAARESGYSRKDFSPEAMIKMKEYPWIGNVRELKNFVERIYILTPSDFVDVDDLYIAGLKTDAQGFATSSDLSFRQARAEFEKDYLLNKIQENQGNISKTAESIGLERSYLHRKIKSYGIDVN